MERLQWRPGNMLYPVPSVLVSCGNGDRSNMFTVAWTGTICSDPAMCYISVRKERFSYDLIKESGEFVINLPTRSLVKAVDYCGVVSGRDHDKWQDTGLTPLPGSKVSAPLIAESPVALECTVTQIIPLGSHDMFLGKIEAVSVDPAYMDENGKFHLEKADLITYSHGTYYTLGDALGTFGYSVRKPSRNRKKSKRK